MDGDVVALLVSGLRKYSGRSGSCRYYDILCWYNKYINKGIIFISTQEIYEPV
jgi:hypothetical protein